MFKAKLKTYQLGLYGLSGAGKTCILTALAMPKRQGQGQGSDYIVFIPSAGQDSKKLIDAAVSALEKGEVPPPTSLHQRPRHEYDFNTTEHQNFRVEIIDYSGELLHPDSESQALSDKLRKHFSELDGILVLAAAPNKALPEIEKRQLHQDINKLTQAFATLKKDMRCGAVLDVPVALLISKWDRYSTIDYENPVTEEQKLQGFLASGVPHKSLADTLKNTVMATDFRAFPVSAFGASEVVKLEDKVHVERPQQIHPLQSFNLEQAFIWIAKRRDEIDYQRYQNGEVKHLLKCSFIGKDLLRRFPEKSDKHRETKALLNQCHKRQSLAFGVIIFVAFTLFLVGELVFDMRQYYLHHATMQSADSQDSELNQAETWFKSYQTSATDYRHLFTRCCFLSRQNAEERLKQLQVIREQRLWQPVVQADTLQAKEPLAQAYLKYYPNGANATPARELIEQAKRERERWANDKALQNLTQSYQLLNLDDLNQIEQTLVEIDTIITKLQKLPLYPQAESDIQKKQRNTFAKMLHAGKQQAVRTVKEIQFKEYAIQLFEAEQYLETAKALHKRHPVTQAIDDLKKLFRSEVVKRISAKVQQLLLDNNPQPAKKVLAQYFHPDFPPSLQTRDGKMQLQTLQQHVDVVRDRQAYRLVQKHRTLDSIQRYLQDASIPKIMEKPVLAYKTYLNSIRENAVLSNLSLQITRIEWHTWDYGENWLKIDLNAQAQPIFHREIGQAVQKSTSRNLGVSQVFSLASNHEINLKIYIDGKRSWDFNFFDNQCSGNKKQLLSEAARSLNGIEVPLYDDSVVVATLYLKLHGYPQSPDLPPFREH